MPYPAFDILAAALLRLRVFGGECTDGGTVEASCCSSTLARFLRDRLFKSGASTTAAPSCSGLGSRATAAFLFLEPGIVVEVAADGAGFGCGGWVV
jgi:hypothetical protein